MNGTKRCFQLLFPGSCRSTLSSFYAIPEIWDLVSVFRYFVIDVPVTERNVRYPQGEIAPTYQILKLKIILHEVKVLNTAGNG